MSTQSRTWSGAAAMLTVAAAFGMVTLATAQGVAASSQSSANSNAKATAGDTALQNGSQMNAELKSKLDTHHAKVGDNVSAVVSDDVKQNGKVVLPKGTKLTGHVTSVTAAGNSKSASSISVVFDHAMTPKGVGMPFMASIAGVTSAQAMTATDDSEESMNMGAMPSMGSGVSSGGAVRGGGGLGLGSVTGGAVASTGAVVGGATANTAAAGNGVVRAGGSVAGGVGGDAAATASAPIRASNGTAFQVLTPAAGAAAGSGSMLSAQHGDVRLDSGTHLQLRAMGQ